MSPAGQWKPGLERSGPPHLGTERASANLLRTHRPRFPPALAVPRRATSDLIPLYFCHPRPVNPYVHQARRGVAAFGAGGWPCGWGDDRGVGKRCAPRPRHSGGCNDQFVSALPAETIPLGTSQFLGEWGTAIPPRLQRPRRTWRTRQADDVDHCRTRSYFRRPLRQCGGQGGGVADTPPGATPTQAEGEVTPAIPPATPLPDCYPSWKQAGLVLPPSPPTPLPRGERGAGQARRETASGGYRGGPRTG